MKLFVLLLAAVCVTATAATANKTASAIHGHQDDRVLVQSNFATSVCFKHHGCGLDGKRGERNYGISPIIPAANTKQKCCNKKNGVGPLGELVHAIAQLQIN
ncbi:hypothetical protein LEN26_007131 [Aphanomyces euteiches]|nr:hypothetical protein AeMF1_010286 [Aphanomyces euteiches]KAH9133239.1 hypothetical protein LEN26_007131 [Aphanomyces euteiches]KAH9190850.1 hypothetical protein AeNC1_007164 [Aphanomyces euteiches]